MHFDVDESICGPFTAFCKAMTITTMMTTNTIPVTSFSATLRRLVLEGLDNLDGLPAFRFPWLERTGKIDWHRWHRNIWFGLVQPHFRQTRVFG